MNFIIIITSFEACLCCDVFVEVAVDGKTVALLDAASLVFTDPRGELF